MITLAMLTLLALTTDVAAAQEPTSTTSTISEGSPKGSVLRVGTKQSPPFAMKNPDGSWTGISIELWKRLANDLDLEYEFKELSLDEILAGLESGELDVAVAAISVTASRHERIGFCHPHFSTGLGIAVSAKNRKSQWLLLRQVLSSRLLTVVLIMVLIVGLCGFLFWLFERKKNSAMFSGERRQGIGMGLWWSTILLFGHKGIVPVSVFGRVLATFAMVASIFLLSLFTGVITSVLTVQQLDAGISRATDLHKVRVATVKSSTSANYLRQRRIPFVDYETPHKAIESIVSGDADAVVYDAALLKYLASKEFANQIEILPVLFNVQEYAIALQPNSKLRKRLNEKLLRYRESDAWDELIYRYLGS